MNAFDRHAMAALRRFRLWPRNTVLLVPLVGLLVPVALASALRALHVSRPVAFVAVAVAFLPALFMFAAILRGLTVGREYNAAHEREDVDEIKRLKRLMEGDDPVLTAFGRANSDVGDAELLLAFERWAEARDLFATIDREALPALRRPGVLNELGYATAHAGEPGRAISVLEASLCEAEAQAGYPDEKMWVLRTRFGIGLSLAGRHEDAIEVLLHMVTSEASDSRLWTAAHFFLACSLRASGNFDDAAVHLEAAADGDGRYVERAKAALQLAAAAPLRAGSVQREPEAQHAGLESDPEASADVPARAKLRLPR